MHNAFDHILDREMGAFDEAIPATARRVLTDDEQLQNFFLLTPEGAKRLRDRYGEEAMRQFRSEMEYKRRASRR